MHAVLELRQVSKQFPNHRAVDGVSLAVPRGSLFSLVGPSGCGKTTTLRMVAGLETPTAGELLLNGVRIDHLPPYSRNVSTVFQSYALFPHLTVRGNIEFGLRRRNTNDLDGPVRRVLELFRIAALEFRYPHQISGGERQRVALARSLVIEPDVLLLDEPLAALDPQLRVQVRGELKSLQRRVGITFLMVTHDREDALSLSDQIAVMNHGRIEQVGPPREIYDRPATRFVASFLGPMNWLGVTGLRPEAIRLTASDPPPGTRAMQGVIRSTAFLGNCFHIEARLDDGHTILCELERERNHFEPGERVQVWWRSEDEIQLPAAEG